MRCMLLGVAPRIGPGGAGLVDPGVVPGMALPLACAVEYRGDWVWPASSVHLRGPTSQRICWH